MSRQNGDYERKLIAFRRGDIEVLRKHFPNIPYNAIVRSLVEQFTDALEAGQTPTIDFNPNKIEIK